MAEHKKRAEVRAENNDPINFTCGVCFKVVPYKGSLVCECMKKEEDDSDSNERENK